MPATLRLYEHPNFEGRSLLASSRFSRRYRHVSIQDLGRSGLNDRLSSFRLATRSEPRGYVLVFAEHPTGNLHEEYPYHNRFDVYSIGSSNDLDLRQISSRMNDRVSDILLIRRARLEVAFFLDNERVKRDLVEPAVRQIEPLARAANSRFRSIRVGQVATRLVARPAVAPNRVLLGINMDFDVFVRRPVNRPVDGDLEILFSVEAGAAGAGVAFRFRGFRFDADARRRVRKRVEGIMAQILSNERIRRSFERSLADEVNSFLPGTTLEGAYVLPGNANRYRRDATAYAGDQATSGVSIVFVCDNV